MNIAKLDLIGNLITEVKESNINETAKRLLVYILDESMKIELKGETND